MRLAPTGRTVFARLGKCGLRSLQSRQFRTPSMSVSQDTHPSKKLKTTEARKVARPSPSSMVTGLTQFSASFRSSVHTTVHSIAMRPWQCTCSGKHQPTPMQVCYLWPAAALSAAEIPSGRVDPNQRPSNVGYLRYSGGCRGRIRRKLEEVRPPPTRFRRNFRSWVPN